MLGIRAARRIGSAVGLGFTGVRDAAFGLVPRQRVTRSRLFATEADGGIARFRAMADAFDEDEFDEFVFRWKRTRLVYVLSMLTLLGILIVSVISGLTQHYYLGGLLVFAAYCSVLATHADFMVWRLQQRRFGPFGDYLNKRLPRNMQIMERRP